MPEICAAVEFIAPGKRSTTQEKYNALTKAAKFL